MTRADTPDTQFARKSRPRLGIRIALQLGMAIFTKTSANEVREVEWLHWLFIRGNQALSCDVDVRGDGFYAVSLFPLWRSGEATTETFTRPGEALRRHAEIANFLHDSGWLLAEGGPVGAGA